MFAALFLTPVVGVVRGAVSYSVLGETISQNFDGLPSAGTTSLTGSATVGNQVGVPGVGGWELAKVGGSATVDATLNTAYSTGGRFYAMGTVVGERALVALGSGSFFGASGTSLINDTGMAIEGFAVSFASEIWGVQGTTTATASEDRLAFAYGFSGGLATAANYLSSPALVAFAALDAVSPASQAVTGAVSGTDPARLRDGNGEGFRRVVSGTVSGISWEPGQTLFLRWSDADTSGFDAMMGVDDFAFTAAVPEPSSSVLGAVAAVGLLSRRRRQGV